MHRRKFCEIFSVLPKGLYLFVFTSLSEMLDIFEAFIDDYFTGDMTGAKQARAAFKLLGNYTGQNPYQIGASDIARLIHRKLTAPKEEDRLEQSSLSLYLFYIAKFYEWLGHLNPDSAKYTTLAKHIKKEIRKLKAEEVTDSDFIDIPDIVKMLTEITELEGKLLVRLLAFSKIPIGSLNRLRVGHIYSEGEYEMDYKGKTIRGVLYSDTPEIINATKERRNLETDDKLLDISVRQIQYLIPKYAKKIGITEKVTPRDLKEFGKTPRLRKWLIREYEKTKKNKST